MKIIIACALCSEPLKKKDAVGFRGNVLHRYVPCDCISWRIKKAIGVFEKELSLPVSDTGATQWEDDVQAAYQQDEDGY